MNAVMLSIRPQWCAKIANGKKTIEVRKSRPKLETPFKCYIYCTLKPDDVNNLLEIHGEDGKIRRANGKVIGEFVCDKMYGIYYSIYPHDPPVFEEIGTLNRPNVMAETCLSEIELNDYLDGETGYGWHISALQIYDKPMELSEFHFPPEKYCEKELCGGCPHDQMADVNGEYAYDCEWRRPITRAPQSWCYVEGYDGKH
jgi:predicted transcriptional regulator